MRRRQFYLFRYSPDIYINSVLSKKHQYTYSHRQRLPITYHEDRARRSS